MDDFGLMFAQGLMSVVMAKHQSGSKDQLQAFHRLQEVLNIMGCK